MLGRRKTRAVNVIDRIRILVFALSAAAALSLAAPALAQEPAEVGTWLTEKGDAHIQIAPCGEALCGKIVWLKTPLDDDGKEKLDKHNPDESLRHRPIIGLTLITGFVKNSDGMWEQGRIYDAGSGDTYKSTMYLEDADKLKLRGYIGIPLFGRSQTWSRVK